VRRRTPAVAACLVVAGLSLLVPSKPTTDSWGWIVWGRELLHLELSTVVPGAPAWKPLPVLMTTPLALAGDAAPTLWLLVARAGALASLIVAYRLGDRLAGRWAGILAVAGLVLSMHWLREFAHGYTEPLAIGLLLAAVDRHLCGRPRSAFLLAAPVALARPEAWCLLVLYGGALARRRRVHPLLLASVVVPVPVLWLVPDWVGSGDPLHGSKLARLVVPTGTEAALTALGEAASIAPLPLSITALAGTAVAFRQGDRRIVEMAAVVVAWVALLAALMLIGYPASSRYFVIPAGLLCVVGAAGAVCLARAASGRPLRLAVAGALALAALPPLAVRAAAVAEEQLSAVSRARLEADLRTTVDRSRGALLYCGTPVLPQGLAWAKGIVAWELDLPLRGVRASATSAYANIEELSRPGSLTPPPAPRRAVAVRPRARPFVLLSPFGGAPLRVADHPRMRLATVAGAGRWRAVMPIRAGGPRPRSCSIAPVRPVGPGSS